MERLPAFCGCWNCRFKLPLTTELLKEARTVLEAGRTWFDQPEFLDLLNRIDDVLAKE